MWSDIRHVKTDILEKTHPIRELDAKMNPAILAKAKKMAEQESLNIILGMLREKDIDGGQ